MELHEEIHTAAEVAEALGCTTSTLEQLHRDGSLCGLRLGTCGLHYPRRSLMDQLDNLVMRERDFQANRRTERSMAVAYSVGAPPRRQPPDLGGADFRDPAARATA